MPFSIRRLQTEIIYRVNFYTSIDTSLPGDLGGVKVKTNKGADFLGCERCRIYFIDP